MKSIKVAVRTETDRLRSVLVHNASTILPVTELSRIRKTYGSEFEEEAKYHPESGTWNVEKLKEQVLLFHAALKNRGVKLVHSKDIRDAWLQFFVRDVGFVVGDTFYFANPAGKVRGLEKKSIEHLKPKFSKYIELKTPNIEGGDIFVHQDKVFVGLSRRTTKQAFQEFQGHAGRQGFECIPIECEESVLHLDCRFNVISARKAFLSHSGLKKTAIQTLEAFFECIPLEREDVLRLASNYFIVSPSEIISTKDNTRVNTILSQEGFNVIELDYSEPIKLWGSVRCTVCPLSRE